MSAAAGGEPRGGRARRGLGRLSERLDLMEPDLWQRLAAPSIERRAAVILAALAVLFAGATFAAMAIYPTDSFSTGSLIVLLNIDLVLLLLLGLVIGRRTLRLVVERKRGQKGSRLHIRLIGLFAVVAALPAIVVTTFSVLFLSAGLESWFSEKISNALRNSLNVSRAYLEEHKQTIRADAIAMAADLEREAAWLYGRPDRLQALLDAQVALRALAEAIVFSESGDVIARTGLSFTNPRDEVADSDLALAQRGEALVLQAGDDRVRAVVRLDASPPSFLYVGRFVDPTVLDYVQRSQEIVADYDEAALRRADIQIAFALIFAVITLLVLAASVWVGMGLADRLATPIARLMAAADRVSAGDLMARVPVPNEKGDLADLSIAFNHMTRQLADQRKELLNANRAVDERRRFIEAVLADISPGVLSLDRTGEVALANDAAARLLERRASALVGQNVRELLPEIGPFLDALERDAGKRATTQIDYVGNQRRKLLARLGARDELDPERGWVLSFDDVTELIEAQKQAAWADVARKLAHEIKNPLTPIRLSAERLSRRFAEKIGDDRPVFDKTLDVIKDQVDVIGRLVDEFSAYARMPAPILREVDLRGVVAGVIELHRSVGGDKAIAFESPREAFAAKIDRHKITQALTNLVRNAFEASRGEPDRPEGAPLIEIGLARDGARVVLDVADRGPGFDHGLRERLLEPYVTTKAEGSGLGLAIVRKIMDEHGGAVQLLDREGGGAKVRLVFPAAPGENEASAAAARS